MSFQILQRSYAPFETLANFPPYGDSRLVYRATDTGYIYTWDVTAGMYKLASISPDHTHNYAGSSAPGGAATSALECTGNSATATTAASCTGNSATATTASSCSGNAATATKLATPRTLTIGSKANTFDGSADKAWTLAEIGADPAGTAAAAVSAHNTAPDAHADLRTLVGDRALIGHQHARTDLPWVTDSGAALLTAASASAQRTALGMTAWAVAPWTDGTTSDIPEGTQLYFTDARADARIAAQKGQAEGIMPLDSSGKAPLAYIPDALIGQVKFKGVWDAATNSPVLPSATTSMGHYYVTSVAGSYGGIDYGVGDWCISDGTAWGKVDNSDAITSFAGRVGAILPIASDYSAHYLGISEQAADSAKFGGQLPSYYSVNGHMHSGYESALGSPSVSGYLLSSTPAGVRSWVAPYSHPATHAQSVIDSSTGWITTALSNKAPLVSPSFTGGVAVAPGTNYFALAVTTSGPGPWQTVFSRSDLANCSWKTFLNDDGAFSWYNGASTVVPLEMYQSGLIRLGGYGPGVLTTDYQGKIGSTQGNVWAIENLAGTPGVPVKTAANTWELKNGKTAAVVIGGTTLNFQNGVLVSYTST